MTAPTSAFQSKDGKLFATRSESERHELMLALVEKFGEKKAIALQVIVDERQWFEDIFAEVKKDLKPMPISHLREVATG